MAHFFIEFGKTMLLGSACITVAFGVMMFADSGSRLRGTGFSLMAAGAIMVGIGLAL